MLGLAFVLTLLLLPFDILTCPTTTLPLPRVQLDVDFSFYFCLPTFSTTLLFSAFCAWISPLDLYHLLLLFCLLPFAVCAFWR